MSSGTAFIVLQLTYYFLIIETHVFIRMGIDTLRARADQTSGTASAHKLELIFIGMWNTPRRWGAWLYAATWGLAIYAGRCAD